MIDFVWPALGRRREAAEPLPLLAGYGKPNRLQRNRKKLAGLLFFLMLIYVLAFEIIGRFLIVYFLIPFALLILLIIWALPETGRPPTRLLKRLFYVFLAGALFWPDYFAIALPGLPWITMLRLTGLPMLFILLIALSVSREFRASMKGAIGDARLVTGLLVAFTALAALSLFYSGSVFHSFNRLVNVMVGWTGVFFISCYIFSRPGHARRVAILLWAAAAFWLVLGFVEWWLGRVPWAGHVPSFLQTEDEFVQRVLEGSIRSWSGAYRIQAKFFTPISFAEFLALITPFVLHWMMVAERFHTRVAAAVTLPLIFLAIMSTDSRLGAAGFMMTFVVYALVWGVRRWRYVRDSILGPAITIAYPVLFALFIAATFLVGRLRKLVWGGGQHQSSTDARWTQLEMAIPLIQKQPWGYGFGLGGGTLGYTDANGLVTIDSYYLGVILDVGVVGLGVYVAMVLSGIYLGGRRTFDAAEGEVLWIAPATIALINFAIIKVVLAQVENHSLVFALLGMIVALAWRIRQGEGAQAAPVPIDRGQRLPARAVTAYRRR